MWSADGLRLSVSMRDVLSRGELLVLRDGMVLVLCLCRD